MTRLFERKNLNHREVRIVGKLNTAYEALSVESKAILSDIKSKDEYTLIHCLRVGIIADRLARFCNVPKTMRREFFEAACTHDAGKLAIEDSILKKPSRLTNDEFAIMKTHAASGESYLKDFGSDDAIAAAVYHHERYDGTGYNWVLGNDIPYVARLVAVADTIDAILSTRVYDQARTSQDCRHQVKINLGKQFDPEIGKVALAHWTELVAYLYPQV